MQAFPSNMLPLVTIGIPTRSRVDYLKTAVESALAQTYPRIQIVVADNNSTDGTADYIKSLNDPRIVYLKSDVSLSFPQNCNRALAAASGEFFIWVSDDDALSANYIERGAGFFLDNPLVAGYFGAKVDVGHTWKGPFNNGPGGAPHRMHNAGEFAITYLAAGDEPAINPSPLTPTVFSQMMRTAHVKALGGLPEQFNHFYVDLALALGIWARGGVVLDPQAQFFYRSHPENSTKAKNPDAILADIRTFWDFVEIGPLAPLYAKKFTAGMIAGIMCALEKYKLAHDLPALRFMLGNDVEFWHAVARYPRDSRALRAHIAGHVEEIAELCRGNRAYAAQLAGELLARFPIEAAPLARIIKELDL